MVEIEKGNDGRKSCGRRHDGVELVIWLYNVTREEPMMDVPEPVGFIANTWKKEDEDGKSMAHYYE